MDLNAPDELAFAGPLFDAVICVSVVEHVTRPLALLQLLHRITCPGGLIYVIGPNVDAVAHRVLGRRWPYYCPAEHLTLPSFRALRKAMDSIPGGSFKIAPIAVRYSLKYMLRYLRLPDAVPQWLDFTLPIPAGAFEVIWFA